MEESIYELREAVGLEEINRLLATGRWKVRSLDWDDEIPVAKLVRNKRRNLRWISTWKSTFAPLFESI